MNINTCMYSVPYSFAGHLGLHRLQEVSEPLKRTGLWANPVEIDLPQFECSVFLGELVENRLENWSERSHSNTSPHEQSNFVRKHILTSRPEWPIHGYAVKNEEHEVSPHMTLYLQKRSYVFRLTWVAPRPVGSLLSPPPAAWPPSPSNLLLYGCARWNNLPLEPAVHVQW